MVAAGQTLTQASFSHLPQAHRPSDPVDYLTSPRQPVPHLAVLSDPNSPYNQN